MPLLALLLPALIPVFADGIRSIIGKFTNGSGAKPQNIEETIKLMEADTARLKVLAELDRPADNISSWVSNLRSSFRYIAAGMIILSTLLAIAFNAQYSETLLTMSGSIFAFLFGDRLYLSLRSKKN